MENDANIKFENTNELSVDEFAKIVASCYACKVFTRTFENRVIVAIDTFLPGYDEGVCNVLEKVGNSVEISDNRSVTDYWEIMDVDMRLHKEKICKIESEYGLSFADANFISAFHYDVSKLQDNVAKFNEALFKLAKIDED